MTKVVDLASIINPDSLASEISNLWTKWNSFRLQWMEEKKELRNYLYATSTLTTTNAVLPWSNTTTTPKLTQISDNLHANYMATLFPQNKWMKWEALDKAGNTEKKAKIVQSYMDNKLRQSGFINTASKLVQDFTTYGNCFATVTFEKEYETKENGEPKIEYIGPKIHRISPFDIVFDPTASSFCDTPKIIRSMHTLGDIKEMSEEDPAFKVAFERIGHARNALGGGSTAGSIDYSKSNAYVADGFSDIRQYYNSGYVEVLTFYGTIYDVKTGEVHCDRVITVVDRAYLVSNKEIPTWSGHAPIFHAGWRERPDNLYAMGPLDNLVGMQYRLDHLENLKADVFDQIAYPMLKIKGDVEEFTFEPGGRIYMGDEGDVGYLSPDTTALQADLQIKLLEDKMEEMAGAPRQAMGIRTPGEKTAFEVQQLQNSASRIFEHKAAHFERTFLEPILNAMLESARQNMDMQEQIATLDKASGATIFIQVKREDIAGNGKIVPIGARHFAERARRVQNLQSLWQIKMQDPSVAAHMSGKEFARILSEELGEPSLFGENIGIMEQGQAEMAVNDAQANNVQKLEHSANIGV